MYNSLTSWIIGFTELSENLIWKTDKKYGYNISSVNGVAEFVKERLYPYNGTEQVLLDGNALDCYNIEDCAQCTNANCTLGYDAATLVHFNNHQASQG